MTLWQMVRTILTDASSIIPKLGGLATSLREIKQEQAEQTAILKKILKAVQPAPATKLILTLGKPGPQ